MNPLRPALLTAAAGLALMLSGCVVAPVAPRPVVYRPAPVYVAPPAVVVRPAPHYYCRGRCW